MSSPTLPTLPISTISSEDSVAGIVRRYPSTSRVFEAYQIDYCCGGKVPLEAACEANGLDLATIVGELSALSIDQAENARLEIPSELGALIENILEQHHHYLDQELPLLTALASKVARAHGKRDQRLMQVDDELRIIAGDLAAHMKKEELVLFPMIRMIESGRLGVWSDQQSLQQPILRMEAEHEAAGAGLAALRKIMNGFTPPDWACASYRALLHRLDALEKDLHVHVHKENNILFPMAIEAESALRS